MEITINGIPNIKIENTGSIKKLNYVIKGFIELPCWNDYYLSEKPNNVIKTKVVTGGRIELYIDHETEENGNIKIGEDQRNAYFFL